MFAMLGLGIGEIVLLLLLIPLLLAIMAFWIWMLVDVIQNKGVSDGEKIGWVLAIVFFHFLGSVLYFFLGRPKGKNPPSFEPPVMPLRG
jgi:hypothetical protein